MTTSAGKSPYPCGVYSIPLTVSVPLGYETLLPSAANRDVANNTTIKAAILIFLLQLICTVDLNAGVLKSGTIMAPLNFAYKLSSMYSVPGMGFGR